MSSKGCELCSKPARMFCESDQASLCWDCDDKVHSANFLVAKHCRTLLCHVCSSPTPWKAAGLNLGPAVSVCRTCSEDRVRRGTEASGQIETENQGNDDSQESESDDGEFYSDSDCYSDGEEGEEEEEEEEDGENQVVPWSICDSAPPSPSPPPPSPSPPPPSSSGSEEDVSLSSLKRTRDLENEDGCCSSQDPDYGFGSSNLNFQDSVSLFRPLKVIRTNINVEIMPSEEAVADQNQVNSSSRSAAIVDRLRRFQREIVTEGGDASAMIFSICKLPRDS